jgi:hypothetical protein
MAIYVDPLRRYKTGLWCHMMSDVSVDELVLFAASIKLSIDYLQNHPLHPHYDLRASKRKCAIQAGATEISTYEMVQKCSKYFK